jgi:glycine/D-amino acid oxidase-like deaminating enzyme
VDTSMGFIASPVVVLAAGVGTSLLCAPLGVEVPVASSPALLARVTAPANLIRTLVSYAQEARQAAEGQVLVPRDYRGETTNGDLRRAGQEAARLLADTFSVDSGVDPP